MSRSVAVLGLVGAPLGFEQLEPLFRIAIVTVLELVGRAPAQGWGETAIVSGCKALANHIEHDVLHYCLGRAWTKVLAATRLPVQQRYSFALSERRLKRFLCSQILAT